MKKIDDFFVSDIFEKRPRIYQVAGVAILVLLLLLFATYRVINRPILRIERSISALLKDISAAGPQTATQKTFVVKASADIEGFGQRLNDRLIKSGFQIIDRRTFSDNKQRESIFEIGRDGRVIYILRLIKEQLMPKLVSPKAAKAKAGYYKVAIVIDDWGYNMHNMKLLDSIPIPLTMAILPNLPFSRKIAQRQSDRPDRQVILHMPMKPDDDTVRLEKNTLMPDMDESQIDSLLNISLGSVPYAKGVSNHMGSSATRDRALIRTVMKGLKQRGLYFLDSLATVETVCQEEADKAKVDFIKRDIFLDNNADRQYITSQMDKLIGLARRIGYGVGIGHDRELTLQIIMDYAQKVPDDIRFVLISEVVE